MKLKTIINWLLMLFLFLLPWQTRWIWHQGTLNGGEWEYGTFSLYGTEILLWAAVILFGVKKMAAKSFRAALWKNKLFHCLIALLLVLAMLAMFSLDKKISFYHLYHVIEVVLAAGVVYSLGKEAGQGNIITSFWLGGVVQGALAIWQFLAQYVPGSKWLGLAMHKASDLGASVIEFGDERWLRAYGSFGSPNSLGLYLAVVFVVGLILFCHSRESGNPGRASVGDLDPRFRGNDMIKKMAFSAGQLIILAGLLFSFSRGAWVAVASGVLVMAVLLFTRKDKEALSQLGKQAAFSLLLVVMVAIIFKPVFAARFNTQNRLEAISVNERKSQTEQAINFFLQKPLIGVGAGVYTLAVYRQNPHLPAWRYQPAHNVYLLMLAELGIVGLVIFVLFHCFIVLLLIKRRSLWLALGVVLIIGGLFDHWYWSMYTGIMVWWVGWCFILAKKFLPAV